MTVTIDVEEEDASKYIRGIKHRPKQGKRNDSIERTRQEWQA